MSARQEMLALVERWDRQQEGYIKQRDERFNVMFDILAHVFGDRFTVVDAACGPGSLTRRLLDRFPAAKVVAIDADVMLLDLARASLADYGDRVHVVEADLADPSWAERARDAAETLGGRPPVALVSTTALHWLSPGGLAEFYGAAGALLANGGVVMNGDHMRFDARWPTLASAAAAWRDRMLKEAVDAGEDDWEAWWRRVADIPALSELKTRRDAFFASRPAKRPTSYVDCSVDFHVAALRHAGFVEVGTAWQAFDNYIVFGRRPE